MPSNLGCLPRLRWRSAGPGINTAPQSSNVRNRAFSEPPARLALGQSFARLPSESSGSSCYIVSREIQLQTGPIATVRTVCRSRKRGVRLGVFEQARAALAAERHQNRRISPPATESPVPGQFTQVVGGPLIFGRAMGTRSRTQPHEVPTVLFEVPGDSALHDVESVALRRHFRTGAANVSVTCGTLSS